MCVLHNNGVISWYPRDPWDLTGRSCYFPTRQTRGISNGACDVTGADLWDSIGFPPLLSLVE